MNTVKDLNQILERPPDQTSLVIIVKRMQQKLSNQLVIKFQFAHLTTVPKQPFKLANFEKHIHNVDLSTVTYHKFPFVKF